MELLEEEAVCTFCNCILKVGKNMFMIKCKCSRDTPILAHEICTTNNHQANALCGQCREPFQNIPITLRRAPAAQKRMKFAPFFKGCFSAKNN